MKGFKNRFVSIGCVAAMAIALFTGCAEKKVEPPKEEAPPKPEIVIEVVEEPEEPDGPRSLLTNEITETDVSNMRPLSVMIENTSPALPHYGLADAGVIYEVPVEGGITRYLGLYDEYEDFERLGNVRSARPYFIYLSKEYEAIFAHFGQSTEARGILNSKIVDEVDGMTSSAPYFRSSDKKAPHNAYINSEGLLKEIDRFKYDREYDEDYEGHFTFAQEENLLPEGEDATYLKLYYYNNKPYFEYDEITQTYKRYEYGKEEPDALSEDGINVTNIILQNTPAKVADSEGHMSFTLVGKGTGKFFTRGRFVDITWEKDSNNDRTVYYMEDGEEIELNTGKTFICIIEESQKNNNIIEPEPKGTKSE